MFFAWALYGLFGYSAIEALYKGDAPGLLGKFMAGRSTTPLVNYLREADRMMIENTFGALALVLFLLLMRVNRLMPVYVCVSALLLVPVSFGFVEAYPSLAHTFHLDAVDYFGYKDCFIPDAVLVYRGRPFLNANFYESHNPHDYGMEAPRAMGHWVTDDEGFRNNTSTGLSDIVIVSDGMLNTGRNYEDTFSKRLQNHLAGLPVRSLSISGHGPLQYVQVMQTYGVKRKPKVAIFGFNEGNDIQEINKYIQWKSGSSQNLTGGYEVGIVSLLQRFSTAESETLRYLRHQSLELAETVLLKPLGHDAYFRSLSQDVAYVRLSTNQPFPIVFIDKQDTRSTEAIQKTENWQELRQLLLKFRTTCVEHAIVPTVMFVPTSAHIYAEYSTDQSGTNWLEIRDQQIRAKTNLENAVERLSDELGISFVSLTPAFELAAKNGRQLYDSFSVHLNSEGTELAATCVSHGLASVVRSQRH